MVDDDVEEWKLDFPPWAMVLSLPARILKLNLLASHMMMLMTSARSHSHPSADLPSDTGQDGRGMGAELVAVLP